MGGPHLSFGEAPLDGDVISREPDEARGLWRELSDVGRDHADFGVSVEEVGMILKTPWRRHVITVADRDVASSCRSDRDIARLRSPDVSCECMDLDSRILVTTKYARRVVARPIVNDDQLPIGQGLAENAFNRIPQPLTLVV